MADAKRDNEIREEIKRAKKAQHKRVRKPIKLRRVLPFVLLLALVLGAVGFAAYKDIDSMDSLRRLFTYNKVSQDADGKAEMFRFDSDRTARYALLGKKLLAVSTTRILLLGENGEEIYSHTVNFTSPAIEVCGQTAAVYDVGGAELYILGTRGLVRDMSDRTGNGLISAALNDSGYLALTTLKSGYRAAVSVYDASGGAVFEFNSSERYISDARALNDNRHVAVVALGEADGVFASTLAFYAFDSETAVSTTTLSGSMVLALKNLGSRLAAFEDDRLTFFNADGSLSGSCRYDYPYLRAQSAGGNDFAALLLSRYRSGSALRLITVGAEGETLGSLDVRREVLDVSAAGRYLAVLYSDSLTVYTSDLVEYATLSNTEFARKAVMRPDGTVLLLGASRAWLYVPK